MKTPWDIHYEAFLHAGGIYTEKHARLYADLANDLIAKASAQKVTAQRLFLKDKSYYYFLVMAMLSSMVMYKK